jgi:quinol monooxygenase YgiN
MNIKMNSTASGRIVVAGYLVVAAADRDAFLQRSRAAVALARTTPGCRDFAVSADIVDDERVNVFERWDSREALEAFRGSGPDDSTGALVRQYQIAEYVVTC